MASILNSTEEHPEYLFDHLISVELKSLKIRLTHTAHCLALDPFTNQIYVFIHEYFHIRIGSVLIYSQCGEILRSFPLEDMGDYSPNVHGMAIHRDNIYIISLPSRIFHFKVADSMTLIGSKNAKGSGIGKFDKPGKLDLSSEGDLFVTDFGHNRVQILDGNLQYKRHISHHSMLKPRDVKLTPDEVYVLGVTPEQSTYCIHIFTYMGKKLRSIILNGIPNSMLWRGFCVDTRGNAAIIDDATSQINFLTKEGNLIQTMVPLNKCWTFGKPKNIVGVTWITNQKLIVLFNDFGGGLQIYSYI